MKKTGVKITLYPFSSTQKISLEYTGQEKVSDEFS
jgi:hypothetical protein